MSQTKAQLISDLVQALNFTGTSSAPANGMYLSAANTIKLATNSNGRLTIDSSGNSTFEGDITVSSAQPKIYLTDTNNDSDYLIKNGNGEFNIQDVTNSANRLTINSSGNATFSGTCTATTFIGAVTGTASNASGATGDFSIADKIVHTGDTNTAIRFPSQDHISVETSGSEVLRIDSSGRILIGVDASISGVGLQIVNRYNQFYGVGDNASSTIIDLLKTRNASPGGYTVLQDGDVIGELRFRGSASDQYVNGAMIKGVVHGTPGAGNDLPTDIQFHTMPDGVGSTNERMRIQGDGRVLIGPTSDSGISSNSPLTIKSEGSSATRFNLVNSGSAHAESTQIYSQNQDLVFVAGGSDKLRIKNTGNVGIGTSSPDQILHLATTGTCKFRLEDKRTSIADGSQYGVIQFEHQDSNGAGVAAEFGALMTNTSDGSTALQFITGSPSSKGERLRITSDGKVGIGTTSPSEQFHLLKSHNGHTRAVIQNNWGASATAQLKLISPTDEFQLVKYASGAAALNLSNNSRIYHSVGGEVRHQITADSAGQTSCVVNTPADGGVRSQYVTATKAMSGAYNTFRVTINQSSWGSFFLKVYVSAHDGNTAHKWVAGYMNTGFSTTNVVLSNMTGNFSGGTATISHISNQTWKYEIITNGGNSSVTHPVMGVEFMFGGNGNMLDSGSISLEIS